MKVNFKQLILFVDVARYKSMKIAAEVNNVSSSTASVTIAQLEESLGKILFDRSEHEIRLTNAGKQLYPFAIEILDNLDDAVSLSGRLIIAATSVITDYVLSIKLSQFMKEYPNIRVEVFRGTSAEVLKYVESNRCDIGFVEGKVNGDNIESKLLQEDSLNLICSTKNPLAKLGKLDVTTILELLENGFWALHPDGSGMKETIVKRGYDLGSFFLGDIEKPTGTLYDGMDSTGDGGLSRVRSKHISGITLESVEAMKNYVKNSDALGMIPSVAIENMNLDGIKILDTSSVVHQERHFYLINNKDKYQSQDLKIFINWLFDSYK